MKRSQRAREQWAAPAERESLLREGDSGGFAAVAHLERGFQVAVFEKSSELREVGVGFLPRLRQRLDLRDNPKSIYLAMVTE
jgi:hypothetical protein